MNMNIKIKITIPETEINSKNVLSLIGDILKPDNMPKINNCGVWVLGELRATTSKRKNNINITISQ